MDESILMNYLRGGCNDEECQQVELWCEEAPENRQILEQLYYTLFVGDRMAVMDAVDTEASLTKFKSLVREKEKKAKRRSISVRWGRYASAAAAFLAGLVFAGGIAWGLLSNKLSDYTVMTTGGQVYGDPIIHPQPESYWGNVNPVGYRSCYDEGKRCAETLFMDYYRQNQTRIKIIRIFNTYGPRMLPNDGRVVSNFIIQALNNEDITIYGDGKQTRSFQYIDDLIEGMVRMMDTEDDFTGPVNLGNPNEFPVLELAERVIRMTGSTSKIVFKPLPTDDPKQRQPDIKLAKEKLGWQPTVELEDGLKRMIEYFKNV